MLQPVGKCINNISRITGSKHSSRQQARYVLLPRSQAWPRNLLDALLLSSCYLGAGTNKYFEKEEDEEHFDEEEEREAKGRRSISST